MTTCCRRQIICPHGGDGKGTISGGQTICLPCCITTTNGTFFVGDCVLINHDGAIVNDHPWVAAILRFSHNKKKVMVRRFYRSEDALEKHPFFENDELIWSNRRDTVSIDTIIGKCNVHTLDEYVKLQTVTDEVYYWRFRYLPSRKGFDNFLIPLYCTCQMPYNPDSLMVWCNACKEWCHAECEGMTSDEVERIRPRQYICIKCSSA